MKKNQFFFVIVFWLFSCNADNEIKKESNQIKKEYYTNGKLKSEIEYKGSLKHGKVKIYYDNGSLEKEYSYDKDTLNGPFKSYEVDGKLQSKGFYWRGEAIGPIFHYNKGILQLYNEKDFSGTYYYVKKYLLDGKLIKEEGVCLSPNAIGPDTISKNKTYELLFFYSEPDSYMNNLKAYLNGREVNLSRSYYHLGKLKLDAYYDGKNVIKILSTLKTQEGDMICQDSLLKSFEVR